MDDGDEAYEARARLIIRDVSLVLLLGVALGAAIVLWLTLG